MSIFVGNHTKIKNYWGMFRYPSERITLYYFYLYIPRRTAELWSLPSQSCTICFLDTQQQVPITQYSKWGCVTERNIRCEDGRALIARLWRSVGGPPTLLNRCSSGYQGRPCRKCVNPEADLNVWGLVTMRVPTPSKLSSAVLDD
jgi:hypothetical protein